MWFYIFIWIGIVFVQPIARSLTKLNVTAASMEINLLSYKNMLDSFDLFFYH